MNQNSLDNLTDETRHISWRFRHIQALRDLILRQPPEMPVDWKAEEFEMACRRATFFVFTWVVCRDIDDIKKQIHILVSNYTERSFVEGQVEQDMRTIESYRNLGKQYSDLPSLTQEQSDSLTELSASLNRAIRLFVERVLFVYILPDIDFAASVLIDGT